MMKFALAVALLAAPVLSSANCVGSGSYTYCTDNNGNSYNVQRIGNTTFVNGNNAANGSSWSQTSQTIGNTTFHNGTAANGNSWSGTSQQIGGTTFNSGVDSRGNYYSGSSYNYSPQIDSDDED